MSQRFEPGSLRSVQMINFMKHSNLCIGLTPHVNFITGRNGSGKSSILVAISVGLGCNSRLSGRGSNLADLIKDGQNKAIITITLQNGPDGYNYEVYGETITIKRSITRSSTSYEIEGFKKGNQPLIKEELERIRSFYNIQIDNPCSIMHQDTAREFIGTSAPTKKYELFMRGTLLSHLTEEIAKIKQDIKSVEISQQQRMDEKKELDKEYQKQERKYQIVQEADSIHQRMHDLEDELVWSHYYEANKVVLDLRTKLGEIEAQVTLKAQKVEQKRAAKAEVDARYEESQKAMREANLQIQQIRSEIEELSKKLSPIRAELSQLKAQHQHRLNSVQNLTNDLERKKNELDRLTSKRERIMQEAEQRRLKFIEERQTKLQRLQPECDAIEQRLRDVHAQVKELQSAEQQCKQRFSELDYNYRSSKEKYDTLVKSIAPSDRSQGISGRGFNFKPIGPLLKYVHMKPEFAEWNVAAQHIVGKSLEMYIVSSRQDEQQLRRTNPNASIIIASFTNGRYNIGSAKPPCAGATRVIDVLHFTDEVITGLQDRQQHTVHTADIIFNMIVDQFNADRTWCIENEVLARESAFSGRAPCAITKYGVQYKVQNGFEVRLGAKHSTSRIGQDESERLRELEQEYRRLHDEAARSHDEWQRVSTDLRRVKSDRQRLDQDYNAKTREVNRLKAELQNPPSEGSDIDDRIQMITEQIEYNKRKIEEERNDIPAIEAKIEDRNRQKKEMQDQIQQTKDRLTSSGIDKTSNDQLYSEVQTLQRQLDNEKRELADLQGRADRTKSDVQQREAEAKTVYEKARKHSAEKEAAFSIEHPPRSTTVLSQLLKEERRKYEQAQQVHGIDFNQVRQQYLKLKHEVQKAETYLSDLCEFIDHSREALKSRENKLDEMRHSITRRTKVSFMSYQSKRKYTGKLKFDHEKHVIDIAVKQRADSEFTDVSNLSGGEKSFCLVSLLLSLWDVMECPFYCVDEFDVFMDDVNRQAATSLLVSGAQTMSTRQFIFITPLSLDHLKNAGENVSIFEVNSGDRNAQ